MERVAAALRTVVLMGAVAAMACGREPTEPAIDGPFGDASLAKGTTGTPGTYQLLFLDNSLQPVSTGIAGPTGDELILGAHVETTSGVPATGGSVTFEYCSRKGRPNDINNADEQPREACHAGTASWARLASVPVNPSGNAYMNFGMVMIPRTVGFRFRYSSQRGGTIASGTSPDSNFTWVSATALAVSGSTPIAPSNTQVTLVSGQKVTLTWQDNSGNETGFEVRRHSGGNSITRVTAANVSSLSDSGLAYSTSHCYDVRALRKVGQKTNYSAYSNTACVTTPAPPPPPPTSATGVTATSNSSAMIEVNWNRQNHATEYRIDRSLDGVGAWGSVATVPFWQAYYDTSIVAERTYCYRVVSTNASGEAPPSNSACAAALNAPQLTATLVGPQTLALNWTDNSSIEDGYEVWLYGFRPTTGCYPPNNDGYDAGTAEAGGMVVRLPANTTSWQVPTMVETECFPPMEYWYYVLATRNGSTSSSNTVSASGSGVSLRRRK